MVALGYLYTLLVFFFLRNTRSSFTATSPEEVSTANEAKAAQSNNVKDILISSGVTDGAVSKKDQADAAEKLKEASDATAASKQLFDKLNGEQERIRHMVGEGNLDRAKELLAKKKELLKRIASLGKTLRVEHDARFPHLIGKPIIIIAKDENDTKRAANTFAHLEGLNDVINRIQSPCSSLERIRATAASTKKKSKKDRFAMIQKTLDAMSGEERLNYDRKMIEHYEGIIHEIESGIAKADEELTAAWKNYSQ